MYVFCEILYARSDVDCQSSPGSICGPLPGQVTGLRHQLAAVEAKLSETEKLLAIADPDGFFKAGSAAAKAATLRATQALAAGKLRAEAAEKRRKIREVRGTTWGL